MPTKTKIRSKSWFWYLLTSLALVLTPLLSARANPGGLVVTPAKEIISLEPGEQTDIQIDLKNQSDSARVISVSFVEFTVDASGIPSPTEPTAAQASTWMVPAEAQFTLPAGETKSLDVSVSVPEETASRGYYVMASLMIENETEVEASNETKQEIQTLYSLIVGEPTEELTISSIYFVDNIVSLAINNPGVVHSNVSGKIDLLLNGEVAETYSVPSTNVFPSKVRNIAITIDEPDRLDYEVKASLAYGPSNTILTKTVTLEAAKRGAEEGSAQTATVQNTATVVSDTTLEQNKNTLIIVLVATGSILILAGLIAKQKKNPVKEEE